MLAPMKHEVDDLLMDDVLVQSQVGEHLEQLPSGVRVKRNCISKLKRLYLQSFVPAIFRSCLGTGRIEKKSAKQPGISMG
jgi:hypothetical protein